MQVMWKAEAGDLCRPIEHAKAVIDFCMNSKRDSLRNL